MSAPAPARTIQDLLVRQRAHEFVLAVYRYSDAFPDSEIYGLQSQLRRAAVSIAANIAEGFRRSGDPEKARFLNIAQASLEECRYYLILAQDLDYGPHKICKPILEETSRLLDAYTKAILRKQASGIRREDSK